MDIHHDFSTAFFCSSFLFKMLLLWPLPFCTKYNLDWEATLNTFLAQLNWQVSNSVGCHKAVNNPKSGTGAHQPAAPGRRTAKGVLVCEHAPALSTICRCSQLPRAACRCAKKWMCTQTQEWSDQKPPAWDEFDSSGILLIKYYTGQEFIFL